jgi:C_GCAxxG_C_C family probable redox protein
MHQTEQAADRAEQLFESGYNCAQAVFAAVTDSLGLDRSTSLKLSSSLGGGMGRLREVCGALSALFLVAGLACGPDTPDAEAKACHYRLIQELAQTFKTEHGSIICRELLGLPAGADEPTPDPRTIAYYQARPCLGLVRYAAVQAERLLSDLTLRRTAPVTALPPSATAGAWPASEPSASL